MGTAHQQGQLWGPGARDWSDYNEPMCTPFYEAVLDATGVGPQTRLLDLGCGGGFALLLAARRGATVAGIDATPELIDIARERVPGAELVVGDLEEALPFEPESFDVVTAFNSVQYAADPVSVLKQMAHTAKTGGLIGVLVWGPPESCESGVMFAEMAPLMPPAPPARAWRHRVERTGPTRAACQLGRTDTGRGRRRRQPAHLPRPGHRRPHPAQLGARPSRHPERRPRRYPRRAHTSFRRQPQTRRHLPAGQRIPVPHRPSVNPSFCCRGVRAPNLEGMRAHFGTVIKERTLQTTDLDWSYRLARAARATC